ncbi:MAG: VCBS repeat-containing protein, partial [Planctomycetota bacterium]
RGHRQRFGLGSNALSVAEEVAMLIPFRSMPASGGLAIRIAALGLCTALASAGTQSAATSFSETRLSVQRRGTTLALRDLTGNGALELLRIDANGILVRPLQPSGVYAQSGTLMPWRDATVGWDLADVDGDGRTELLLVTDGKSMTSRSFSQEAGWSEPAELFQAATYLPAGVARVPFARDIDGDGLLDLVVPGPGRFHLRLNRGPDEASGVPSFSSGIEVGYEPEIEYDLGEPSRLSSTFGQSVRVPWFSMEDVDGDGTQDLVSETEERVAFHLARPEIDALPSWELDLTALKNDVSASDINLDDLLSVVSGFAQWDVKDLDGVAPKDLIIGSEGTFKIYLGGAATGPVKAPDQVLKASGNVLYFFVRDVIGSDRPDLQIVRGERVSLARLLKYLVVPGQLDFDVFTYGNENGTFARRPTKRTTLGLRVPRLFKLIDEFEQISEELEAQWDIPAQRLDWDGDGKENDVADAVDGVLRVYRNCAPPEQKFENLSLESGIEGLVERVVLRDLDALDDGDTSVIDLGELDAFAVAPGKALRDATKGKSPVARAPLWRGKDDREIRAKDLDGDGRMDFVTVVDGKSALQVQLLVRK